MGDAHAVIVHHHGHVVGGHAVRTANDHVVQLAHVYSYTAFDHIVKDHFAAEGRFKAHAAAFAGAQVAGAATAVVARLAAGLAGFFAHGLHFFGRARAPVGVAGLQQLVHITVVELGAVGLVNGLAVPVQAQPAHGGQDGVGVFLLGAEEVRILYAQVKAAIEMTASSQQKMAVRAPPMCRCPVGLGRIGLPLGS